jgi:hypothetical protein
MEFDTDYWFESVSERIPRGLPRSKRANPNAFILTDRRFHAACPHWRDCGGDLQSDKLIFFITQSDL